MFQDKKTFTRILLPFLIISLFALYNVRQLNAEPASEKKYKADIDFHAGAKSPYSDILREVINEAFRRIGLKSDVKFHPSQRALIISNTEGDGEAARVINIKELAPDSTDNLLLVPEVSITMKLSVFSKNINIPVEGWESLKPYRNGARKGAKILEKNIPGERTFLASNTQLFRMLDTDRLDTVVEWHLAGMKVIQNLNLPDIKPLEPPIATIDLYPFIHKKHKELIPGIVTALKEMKHDGTYDRLREQVLKDIAGNTKQH